MGSYGLPGSAGGGNKKSSYDRGVSSDESARQIRKGFLIVLCCASVAAVNCFVRPAPKEGLVEVVVNAACSKIEK